mmetsp:Transcript_69890/g.198356  ORF Transcript_69890/g.198356 Transcript_69890/m.198356 type:complete len:321 (-) Transcript_69890:416-1378(-)
MIGVFQLTQNLRHGLRDQQVHLVAHGSFLPHQLDEVHHQDGVRLQAQRLQGLRGHFLGLLVQGPQAQHGVHRHRVQGPLLDEAVLLRVRQRHDHGLPHHLLVREEHLGEAGQLLLGGHHVPADRAQRALRLVALAREREQGHAEGLEQLPHHRLRELRAERQLVLEHDQGAAADVLDGQPAGPQGPEDHRQHQRQSGAAHRRLQVRAPEHRLHGGLLSARSRLLRRLVKPPLPRDHQCVGKQIPARQDLRRHHQRDELPQEAARVDDGKGRRQELHQPRDELRHDLLEYGGTCCTLADQRQDIQGEVALVDKGAYPLPGL